MGAHCQQENCFLALVLYKAEHDSHVEADAGCPSADKRPFELVASKMLLKGIVGELLQSSGKLLTELGILLYRPPSGADESL